MARDGDIPSVLVVYSGEPIGEPVAFGGSFVMNTRAEIEQALRDFHGGEFGDMPRMARLQYRRKLLRAGHPAVARGGDAGERLD